MYGQSVVIDRLSTPSTHPGISLEPTIIQAKLLDQLVLLPVFILLLRVTTHTDLCFPEEQMSHSIRKLLSNCILNYRLT